MNTYIISIHVFIIIYNPGAFWADTRIHLVKYIFIKSFLMTVEPIYILLYGEHKFLKHSINDVESYF